MGSVAKNDMIVRAVITILMEVEVGKAAHSEHMSFGLLKRRFIGSPRRVDIEDTAYRIVKLVKFKLSDTTCTCLALHLANTSRAGNYFLSPQKVLVILSLHIYYYYFFERKYWL